MEVPEQNVHLKGDTNLLHLNKNLLCACSVKVTGKKPLYHDLVEICLLPLNAKYERHVTCLPFHQKLCPKRLDNVQEYMDEKHSRGVSKSYIKDCIITGTEPFLAADRLLNWFEKFKFAHRKKIRIVCYDWVSTKPFIIDWLGEETFNMLIDFEYRDLISTALFLNDKADFHLKDYPYPKTDFAYLCNILKVDRITPSNTLQDAYCTAQCYARMLRHWP